MVLYVPIKDDPIDMKLAEYLNHHPDKEKSSRVKFIRESEGCYLFGTKRVNITLS